jgi:hypothetical protein
LETTPSFHNQSRKTSFAFLFLGINHIHMR